MTNYYTTQSLATAAAAIEQGFEGCETYEHRAIGFFVLPKWYTVNNIHDGQRQWRFPRTPHNVALMDVQKKDVVYYPSQHGDVGGIVTSINEYGFVKIKNEYYSYKENLVIIYRNNKPFPVWLRESSQAYINIIATKALKGDYHNTDFTEFCKQNPITEEE
jgi:hypothetical protein